MNKYTTGFKPQPIKKAKGHSVFFYILAVLVTILLHDQIMLVIERGF